MTPTLTLFPLLFPSGQLLTPGWRFALWFSIVTNVVVLVGAAFAPGRLEIYPIANPFSAGTGFAVVGSVGGALLAAAALTSLVSLILRFRRSRGDERQQMKWVTSAAATLFLVVFAVPFEDLPLTALGNFAILLLAMLIISSRVAVAMMRYHLYDIDVVINRALVHGALTATLAAVYLGSVLLLQLALSTFTEGSGLAVAASTLAAAALVRPARSRIQGIVDRRFFRQKYDAARTLERFGARVRAEVDLETLHIDRCSVVTETMQPAHRSLWLRPHAESRNDFRTHGT